MSGGRDFQRGDIWGDGDEDNQIKYDVGLIMNMTPKLPFHPPSLREMGFI